MIHAGARVKPASSGSSALLLLTDGMFARLGQLMPTVGGVVLAATAAR